MTPLTDVQQVLAYHEDTKHHPYRYARSMGYLDWASQPHPFRSWEFRGQYTALLLVNKVTVTLGTAIL